MIRNLLGALIALGLVGLAVFWFVTRPLALPQDALVGLTADPVRGEYVFRAAGCASCHAAPGAKDAEMLKLAGGRSFASPFGTFIAPNISPDPTHGIGAWSDMDLANALLRGVGPGGQHLFPALPYASYIRMTPADALSLRAYLATLPPDATPSQPHQVGFPFNIRRMLGGWKFLFLREGWVVTEVPPAAETGRYIAEALAHCGECHTPRNALGGLDRSKWLAGAANPAGTGTIPGINAATLTWSEADLVTFFQSGFTPEFDTAGGSMTEVIENLKTLPEADLISLAAYLKAVP